MTALWYFDIISPFAYLQLQRMPEVQALVEVTPIPIALGAVLAHCGQLGPAEIPKKREFAYRFIDFHARTLGFPIRFPPTHPFNPLPALRLLCAVAPERRWQATHAVFNHIWRDGFSGDSAEALSALALNFGVTDIAATISDDAVKLALKENTDAAIAAGAFGVPALNIDGELFWGFDATDYAIAYLRDPNLLKTAEARRLIELPASVMRKRT